MPEPVITRFAPSPTGYLHVGGARTALFNWLLARHSGGKFYIRVEDTDRERNRPELLLPILNGMSALGLTADVFEGAGETCFDGLVSGDPWERRAVLQSKRLPAHQVAARHLLDSGMAYRCVCSAEELAERRTAAQKAGRQPGYDRRCRELAVGEDAAPFVVRFRSPLGGTTAWIDEIKGALAFENDQIEDFVILRSDGTPTYNLAAVADDAWMKISHVVRGDDHVSNTPKQILLYRGLGYEVPRFAHVPMILGGDRSRLSKRHGATSVTAYLDEEGFLPDALRNYLVRLGWSLGDQEVISLEEMIAGFSLEGCGTAAAVFDRDKLTWLSGHYVRHRDPEVLAREWARFLGLPERGDARVAVAADARLVRIVRALQERAKTLAEMTQLGQLFLTADDRVALPAPDSKDAKKWLTPDGVAALGELLAALDGIEPFETAEIHAALTRLAESREGKLARVAQPARIAVSGGTVSPPIDETLAILGREVVRSRLGRAIAHFQAA
ncbi:MAG: glutamate--tRNA ligase [Deltaproteobacteria bacterium]|jgi:glutamyl-tRNA synthetase|nr:glutamate--tRNA ligase [Deltaproteobacteria bacterium]